MSTVPNADQPEYEIRIKRLSGGTIRVTCSCGDWGGVAPSMKVAERDGAAHLATHGNAAHLARLAVSALARFGAVSRDTAEELLSIWAHVAALSDVDRDWVLAQFPAAARNPDANAAYWRGYADGYRDACEPVAGRKEAWAAGFLAGNQVDVDTVSGSGQDEEDQSIS